MTRPCFSICLIAVAPEFAGGAELRKPTVEAFDSYVSRAEARIQKNIQSGSFLWSDESPDRLREVRAGQIVVQPYSGNGAVSVPNGLIHDWLGAMFVAGATLEKTVALMQDYDRQKEIYKPEVLESKLLSHEGNHYRYQRVRVLKRKILSAVLETVIDADYVPLGHGRCYSRSTSTRITEIENYGKPNRRELPPGKDQGSLWRLNGYWRYQERDGGVYIECETISLTRGIPAGLGWIVEPIVRSLPKESLQETLRATRAALQR